MSDQAGETKVTGWQAVRAHVVGLMTGSAAVDHLQPLTTCSPDILTLIPIKQTHMQALCRTLNQVL